ncbi:MAG: lipocalin family protein [Alistipes sp.]|nr:lipocalin family protein [Alistipes sp.]
MKKILLVAVALMGLIFTGCGEGSKANPLIKGVVGEWHMTKSSIVTSTAVKEAVDVYIEFKADNTFELYQRHFTEPLYYQHYSGTYLITGDVISGKYSDGKSWGAANGYTATLDAEGKLTLVNVDFTDDASVFTKETIPAAVKEATRAAATAETEPTRFL